MYWVACVYEGYERVPRIDSLRWTDQLESLCGSKSGSQNRLTARSMTVQFRCLHIRYQMSHLWMD